ncbi:MAG: 2OG-Fe(II) oxygenase [Gemmatimonadota bacterium]|nr:2OG-Fe(II) oxygenase [Gemmatimonadota bacterium]
MKSETQGLERGERATDFVLPLSPDGTPTRFYSKAGGIPTLLLFARGGDERLPVFSAELDGRDVDILLVMANVTGPDPRWPHPVFVDAKGAVRSAYRIPDSGSSIVFVLDSNLRVLASIPLDEARNAVRKVRNVLDSNRAGIEPRVVDTQAPVLLIPNVLDPEICNFLMQVWENRGNVETGVEQSRGEVRGERIDVEQKSRRDHVVEDDKLVRLLSSTIGRRILPELHRAFAYRATRFEGFKIACYDAESGGFFHAHRDNLSPSTAHRRFALTLNLNDPYTGGCLRFPEFGPHLYRPGAGGAVVFSCSHLHEVTEVTSGRRFALLSFLFGDEGIRAGQRSP